MSEFTFLDEPAESSHLLRERTFGQMWNETWDVFSAHWRRWIALGLIAAVPPLVIGLLLSRLGYDQFQMPTSSYSADSAEWSRFLQGSIVTLILGLVLAVGSGIYTLVVAQGAGSILASQALAGGPVSLAAALRTAFTRRAVPLIGANMLVGFALVAVMLASMALTTCLVGILGFIFLAYMVVAWIPLVNPVVALERGPVNRLLSRAWYFGRGRLWVVVAVLFSLAAVTFMAELPVSLAQTYAQRGAVSLGPDGQLVLADSYWTWQAVFTLISVVEQAVVLPIGVILYTILYYDARARLDVLDADLLIAAGDPPRPLEPWFVTRDLLNMLAVAGLVILLLVALVLSSRIFTPF